MLLCNVNLLNTFKKDLRYFLHFVSISIHLIESRLSETSCVIWYLDMYLVYVHKVYDSEWTLASTLNLFKLPLEMTTPSSLDEDRVSKDFLPSFHLPLYILLSFYSFGGLRLLECVRNQMICKGSFFFWRLNEETF